MAPCAAVHQAASGSRQAIRSRRQASGRATQRAVCAGAPTCCLRTSSTLAVVAAPCCPTALIEPAMQGRAWMGQHAQLHSPPEGRRAAWRAAARQGQRAHVSWVERTRVARLAPSLREHGRLRQLDAPPLRSALAAIAASRRAAAQYAQAPGLAHEEHRRAGWRADRHHRAHLVTLVARERR